MKAYQLMVYINQQTEFTQNNTHFINKYETEKYKKVYVSYLEDEEIFMTTKMIETMEQIYSNVDKLYFWYSVMDNRSFSNSKHFNLYFIRWTKSFYTY